MQIDPHPRPTRRGRAAALALALVLAATMAVGLTPGPAGAAPHPSERAAALAWLEGELAANGHGMPGFAPGTFDWGLTADAALALAAGGRGASTEGQATTANLLDHVSDYGTWDDLGPDYPGVRIAGALGKLLLVAEVQGIEDPADTDGFDLEAEVRATMKTTGDQAGRFSDIDPHFGTNNANGFGQALAMLGLSYTDDGVPAPATTFLLDQQCPDGGFRLNYTDTTGCETAASSDSDTTAMAVQALLVVDRTPAVREGLVAALGWMEARQDPSGGFGGTGPTSNLNTNSTGLIVQALRAAGRTAPAEAGADWVAAAALTPANAASTPAADDVGAIGYTPAARDDALANGIDDGGRDQWRRSTPQTVLALQLPDLGSIGRAPAEPVADDLTPTESFVTAAHVDFLDRLPTDGELALRSAQVAAGSKAAFLRDLASSEEWTGRLVTRFYTDTLGRGPDAAGFAFWTGELRAKRRTVAQVAAAFYASPEYYRDLGGGTPTTWVTDLYEKLLHRSPDASGLAYWVQRTERDGRGPVARSIYDSLESRRDRVTALYQDLLGRGSDAAGRDYWAGRILSEGDLALAVQLAASGEYASRAVARYP